MKEHQGLRHKTISWLAQCVGDLQKQVKLLETENAKLRSENKRLRGVERHQQALAKHTNFVDLRVE